MFQKFSDFLCGIIFIDFDLMKINLRREICINHFQIDLFENLVEL